MKFEEKEAAKTAAIWALALMLFFLIIVMDWLRIGKLEKLDELKQEVKELKTLLLTHRHERHLNEKAIFDAGD